MSAKREIKVLVQRTLRTVRNFLLSPKSREFLIFLFFLVVAFFFWTLQKLNDTYEADLAIPVRLKNVPPNVVMTMLPPEKIHVQVKDRGTVLFNYLLGRSFYPITLDFEELKNEKNIIYIDASAYQKDIAAQLMTTTQINVIKPSSFNIVYTQGKTKKIPVVVQSHIETEKQYYISDTQIQPDSILVYAPQEILDTLTAAYTNSFTCTQVSDTIRRTEQLIAVRGTKFVPDKVDLQICTDMYTEKKVDVPIRAVNFPPDKMLKTFPSKVSLTFQVGLTHFKNITEKDFLITVTYDELLKCDSDKYQVKLKTAPQDVNYIRIDPPEVDFIIEQLNTDDIQ